MQSDTLILTFEVFMKHLLIAITCFFLSAPGIAQSADAPASRDDVILLLQTMHSHELLQKMLAAQSSAMRQMLHDQVVREKGTVPPDFEEHFAKITDEMMKGMPVDDIAQAMIPAYQKHFNHGDIEAMNAFYASPVGQKVLEELPAVTQEGMQAAMPIMNKYLADWKERMRTEMNHSPKAGKNSTVQD